MQAGKLNCKIGLQKIIGTTYTSMNELINTWGTARGIWAEVISTGGGEFYAAQKVNAQTSIVFKVRYATDITVLNRILYNNRQFEILSANDVNGRNIEMLLSCKEVI